MDLRIQFDYLAQMRDLAKARGEIVRFLKFCAVGVSGVAVSMGCLWAFTDLLGVQYVASAAVTSFLAITNNFIWNDLWTFRTERRRQSAGVLLRWLKFAASRGSSLVIGVGALVLLTEVFGLYYLLSGFFGICLSTLCNYLASVKWVWR